MCCGSLRVGSGRSMGMLSKVSSTKRLSCVLAPLVVMPKGMPLPSVNKLRLVPPLARSVGLGPVFFPPERGFGHRPVHALPAPIDAFQIVVLQEGHGPQILKDSKLNQQLKVAMQGTAGAELRGDRFPLTAGSHHIENTIENRAPGQSWPSPLFALGKRGEQRFHPLHQRIGQTKLGIDLLAFHPWTPAKGYPCRCRFASCRSLLPEPPNFNQAQFWDRL